MGTGTSQGVPLIAYEHTGIDLQNPKNWRMRTSVHVIMDGFHVQVDAAPEFRLQCLHNRIEQLDLFILTHGHADHITGMDDLRRFCDLRGGEALPVFSTREGQQRIEQMFPYAIVERPVHKGYPAFQLNDMPPQLETPGGTITSVLLPHGDVEVLGLLFEEKSTGRKFAYYSDCKQVVPRAKQLARTADVVVLDALRYRQHRSHMTLEEAIEAAVDIAAPQTYFTHMTHEIDYVTTSKSLPENVALAWDGLRLRLD